MNSVTCITWVKRGAAKEHPDRVKLTADELKRLIKTQEDKLKKLGIDDVSGAEEEEEETEAAAEKPQVGKKRKHDVVKQPGNSKDKSFDDIINKYSLDDYDDDDNDEEGGALRLDDVAVYGNIADDPFIKDKDDSDDEMEIQKDDNVVAIGRVKGNYCILEAHVYNEKGSNLFCHHDILLPSFPLALEWMDFDPSDPDAKANLVAMGTMEPDIEIWDLDVVDSLEPAYVLQGVRKKKKKVTMLGHSDAVLDLSWNHHQRHVLASGSADFTIGLWNLEEGSMVTRIDKHEEKVQALQWHPVEAESLLSGSFDHTVKVYDCRNPADNHKSWEVEGEVERVLWNVHCPYYFLASTDQGTVHVFDVRQDHSLSSHKAHKAAVTGLCQSSSINNCIVTVSTDKMMKVWDLQGGKLVSVTQKNLKMGELHSAAMSPDSLAVAIGGETDLRVVNLNRNDDVAKHFNLTAGAAAAEDLAPDAGLGTDDEENDAAPKPPAEPSKKKKKHKKKKPKPS